MPCFARSAFGNARHPLEMLRLLSDEQVKKAVAQPGEHVVLTAGWSVCPECVSSM